MDFLTLDEYKLAAEISSTKYDAVLTAKLAFVNEFITNYLGLLDSYQLEVSNSVYELLPTSLPISTIKLVSLTDFTESDVTDYTQFGFKLFFLTSKSGVLNITTDSTSYIVPAAVKEAAIHLLKYYMKEEYKQQQQSGSEQVQHSDPKAVPIHIKSILDLYREA